MKKLVAFTILLLSNSIFGCGYSPYGEDVRYCLFKPNYFNFGEFYSFNYHSNLWGFDYDDTNRINQYDSKSSINFKFWSYLIIQFSLMV